MPDIKIPALGESVAGGQIAKWHFKEGDAVNAGDVLLTLETDKVAAEVTAEASGILSITRQEGEDVEVGAVVGTIKEGGAPPDQAPARETPAKADEAGTTKPAAPEAESKSKAKPGAEPAAAPATRKPEPAAAPAPGPAPQQPEAKPANVTEFRVVPKEQSAAPAAGSAPASPGRTTRKKMTPLRRKIADQLVSAQQTAAILTTFNECDMGQVMALRSKLQDGFVAKHGIKLGFMSFFVKAVVEALKAVPSVNVRVEGDEIIEHHFYDIGVAVGTERGLIVPVLRDCDAKSFAQLEGDILAYASKAKEGKIQLADLTGGVFTISNGGVYGSLLSTPILNPPQSAILGMHTIQQRPMAVDSQVVIRPMMYLALSYDHRVIDGKEAVTFLVRVKECIENPARMLVGA